MNTTTATRYEIDVEDVEYVRHGTKPLLARVYKPRGTGPFPLIIDPLGRYEYAKQKKASGDTKHADEWIKSHDLYWGSEKAMDEGSPTRALERGETTQLPPVIYLQGTTTPPIPSPISSTSRPLIGRRAAASKCTGSKA